MSYDAIFTSLRNRSRARSRRWFAVRVERDVDQRHLQRTGRRDMPSQRSTLAVDNHHPLRAFSGVVFSTSAPCFSPRRTSLDECVLHLGSTGCIEITEERVLMPEPGAVLVSFAESPPSRRAAGISPEQIARVQRVCYAISRFRTNTGCWIALRVSKPLPVTHCRVSKSRSPASVQPVRFVARGRPPAVSRGGTTRARGLRPPTPFQMPRYKQREDNGHSLRSSTGR